MKRFLVIMGKSATQQYSIADSFVGWVTVSLKTDLYIVLDDYQLTHRDCHHHTYPLAPQQNLYSIHTPGFSVKGPFAVRDLFGYLKNFRILLLWQKLSP